ncbi:MAG: chromosomal replication initiator protein DnaA [Pseudomonadota bacterium]
MTRLQSEFGADVFQSWFARLKFVSVADMRVSLSVPTRFLQSWIRENYSGRILQLWREIDPAIDRIELVVRGPERNGRKASVPLSRADQDVATRKAPTALRGVERSTPRKVEGAPLERRYSFESFAVARSNTVAYAAARQVAAGPSGAPAPFNPLVIHGGCGRGKTHLLHAIAWDSASQFPDKRVLHLSAEQFMCRFVSALKSDDALAFKDRLRQIDLLLIDDLQFLQGQASQREFAHTLDALLEACRQVVIVADRPPMALDGLDERVRSRLSGGLVVEVGASDVELRRKILDLRVNMVRAVKSEFTLDGEVVDLIASKVAGNGRDIEGALNRLVAHWDYTGEPVSSSLAEHLIRDLVYARAEPIVRVEDIQRVVSRAFNITKQDMVSSRRTQVIARPRQIAMFLAKELTPRSLPEIGKLFGNRDHTTVIYAVNKIRSLSENDPDLKQKIADLKRAIVDGVPES